MRNIFILYNQLRSLYVVMLFAAIVLLDYDSGEFNSCFVITKALNLMYFQGNLCQGTVREVLSSATCYLDGINFVLHHGLHPCCHLSNHRLAINLLHLGSLFTEFLQ